MITFLLSHQRSGSHFVKDVLQRSLVEEKSDSTPPLLVPPEILTPNRDPNDRWAEWFLETHFNNFPSETDQHLPHVNTQLMTRYWEKIKALSDGKNVLLDVKLNQLHIGLGWYHEPGWTPPMLFEMLRSGKIIFLTRRNVLRSVVSGLVATATGIWHRTQASLPLDNNNQPMLTTTHDELIKLVQIAQRSIETVDRWLLPYQKHVLYLTYEDLFDLSTGNPSGGPFDQVAHFMGLGQPKMWKHEIQRTGNYLLKDVIVDYPAFRYRAKAAGLGSMLDEPDCSSAAEPESIPTNSRFLAKVKHFFAKRIDKLK